MSFDSLGIARRLFMGPDAPWSGHFIFSVDGVSIGHFMEVSGLSVSIKEEEIVEGGQNQFAHKVPGRMTWTNITLKRGITSNDALMDWFRQCSGEGLSGRGNKVPRHTGHLTLKGPTLFGSGFFAIRETVREWAFYDAFPVRWSGPTLSASASDVATETLEIAHHGFRTTD